MAFHLTGESESHAYQARLVGAITRKAPPDQKCNPVTRRSSRKIQEEFPQLGKQYWGKHFWAIGYAAFSSGHVTDEMIREYLEKHDKHPNHHDDNFRVE